MFGAPTRILHPTDFSEGSFSAFAHALALAIAAKARLYLLHIENQSALARSDAIEFDWTQFPHIHEILVVWRILDPRDPASAIASKMGVQISRDVLVTPHIRKAISDYAREHRCDLLVMGTHQRRGLKRWLEPSIAEDASQLAHLPCLFVPHGVTGFVAARTGTTELDCLLIPIDTQSDAVLALRRIEAIVRPMSDMTRIELLHIGDSKPRLLDEGGVELDLSINVRQGAIVETIIHTANEIGARLIAMPTWGRHGFLDGLRGSTTERVLHLARCPVLTIPAQYGES